MTPKNKDAFNGAAMTARMQRVMKQTGNYNNTIVLDNKISHQLKKEKSNETMDKRKSGFQCNTEYPKRLSVSSTMYGSYLASHEKETRSRKKFNRQYINNTMLYLVFLLLSNWTIVQSASTEPSGIRIDPDDGGYTGIVFEIKEEVPEESCAEILKNLKVGNFFIIIYIIIWHGICYYSPYQKNSDKKVF